MEEVTAMLQHPLLNLIILLFRPFYNGGSNGNAPAPTPKPQTFLSWEEAAKVSNMMCQSCTAHINTYIHNTHKHIYIYTDNKNNQIKS